MSQLDDPDNRQTVIEAIEGGAKLDEAAALIGIRSRQTVTRWSKRDTDAARDFRLDIAAARIRRTQLERQTTAPDRAPELPPPAVASGVLPERPAAGPGSKLHPLDAAYRQTAAVSCAPPGLWTRDQYLERLQDVADDDEHPACGTALRLLGGWHIEATIAAKRKIAEREAEDTGDGGTVTRYGLQLPEADSGPGEDIEPDVIDAEIIDDRPAE